jgi:signal transduction histidine kinase
MKPVLFESNTIITTFTSFIIVCLIGIIEFQKKKHQERTINHLKLVSGSIAHELRTPLSSILLGLSSLKTKFFKTSVAPPILNILTQMETSSKTAFTTIDIILSNLRGYNELKKTRMSLADCIMLAIEEYPLSPNEKQCIHLNLDNNYFINGNSDSLKHVIWNLLKNALYQIKKHNKGEIYIYLKSSAHKTTLIFQDTANGITDAEAPFLFENFYSNTPNGSGLGLAFCKKIIESHNGQINFDYSPGNYIEFIISLPNLI